MPRKPLVKFPVWATAQDLKTSHSWVPHSYGVMSRCGKYKGYGLNELQEETK